MIEKILNKFFKNDDVFFIGSTDILPPPLKKDIEKPLVKPEENTKLDSSYIEVNKPYEQMDIKELQDAILAKMAKNGPVTDQMLKSVRENIYHDSLINWVKSFR